MNVSVIMLILGYSYFSRGLGGPNAFLWGSFINTLLGRREKQGQWTEAGRPVPTLRGQLVTAPCLPWTQAGLADPHGISKQGLAP